MLFFSLMCYPINCSKHVYNQPIHISVLMFVCRISAVPVSEEPEYEDFDDKSAYSEVQFAPITTTPNAPNAHKGHKPLAPSPSAPPVPPRQSSKPSVIHKVRTYMYVCMYLCICILYMYVHVCVCVYVYMYMYAHV